MAAPVGLIAGQGRFPICVAQGARERGHRVVAVALRGLAPPLLDSEVDACATLALGELGRLLSFFREEGVERVVMAGKVPKTVLLRDPASLEPDARARAVLARLADRSDDSILGAFAEEIESHGLRLLGQLDLVPELRATRGSYGRVEPTPAQLQDLAFAWPIARALGELDVGQTVVVQDRAVLAVEAIEGTDAAIQRGCGLGRAGAAVLKLAKPRQDPRFDVPAVGPETVRILAECGAAVLAVETGRSLVLDREELVRQADAAGIAVLGVDAASLLADEPGPLAAAPAPRARAGGKSA